MQDSRNESQVPRFETTESQPFQSYAFHMDVGISRAIPDVRNVVQKIIAVLSWEML